MNHIAYLLHYSIKSVVFETRTAPSSIMCNEEDKESTLISLHVLNYNDDDDGKSIIATTIIIIMKGEKLINNAC